MGKTFTRKQCSREHLFLHRLEVGWSVTSQSFCFACYLVGVILLVSSGYCLPFLPAWSQYWKCIKCYLVPTLLAPQNPHNITVQKTISKTTNIFNMQ